MLSRIMTMVQRGGGGRLLEGLIQERFLLNLLLSYRY
jgi:hypothetical protein